MNQAGNGGDTPVYIASDQGLEQVVRALAKLGANVNQACNQLNKPCRSLAGGTESPKETRA